MFWVRADSRYPEVSKIFKKQNVDFVAVPSMSFRTTPRPRFGRL
ncbi:hypothetical protein LEP1GSC060_2171 [Leptospira weilii serovar Ranarum str. ICFT]|uniref:Uncharacterized protein n=1 Tax=Leptospira weilii serovar Ranarum str. ICFT TaxID=1218598 RepID=N1W8S8_9LEPT|nr:hypothetical protein LEP1GSC060_2171 [Leptospira weilii serovar Ranarum str. ICFT]